ncbi:AEC family transporter [Corynebacterium halotolerans]|uniref:Permease n=1 Tax=Corynebacterium halotolerans YIM 70093 = DSM 44683 TaxID=1121362 RepID=M1NUE6_9CORY|nr:AEC family transporter [Corynebacterium halotolerans]AGF73112.1 permease [Corynebacterium halotolerans YIM 70093 = DSM 44683]
MLQVLMGFMVVVIVIAVGWLLGRRDSLGAGGRQALSSFVYLVATPALLFDRIIHTDPAEILSADLVVISVSALVVGLLFFLLSRLLLRRSAADSIIGMLASSYVNAGNLGIPLAVYILDDAAAVVPVVLFQVAFYAPVSLTALDLLHRSKQSNLLRNLVVIPLTNPMLIAALAAMLIAFLHVPVPTFVEEPAAILAGAAVPLALVVFGMSLHGGRVRLGADVLAVAAFKNILQPVVAGLLAHYVFGMTGHALFTAVVLGALPTAQNVLTYALRFRTDEALARDAGVVTTLVSLPVLIVATVLLG